MFNREKIVGVFLLSAILLLFASVPLYKYNKIIFFVSWTLLISTWRGKCEYRKDDKLSEKIALPFLALAQSLFPVVFLGVLYDEMGGWRLS